MKHRPVIIRIVTALILMVSAEVIAAADWGRVNAALPGPPQVIGFYSAGCLAGAVQLPLQGEGFQVMRPSRNRSYGHPNLIAFIRRLGQQSAAQGEKLLIGDLSQPRGGPMPYGHGSHQSGLDVDVWFTQIPRQRLLSRAETENWPMLPVIQAEQGRLDPNRWSPRQRATLKRAAAMPEVERIFVNPIIKQALCRSEAGDRGWLRKLRPWWGHDEHFHVRLYCPPDNVYCDPQRPLPPGDGCDESLDQWAWQVQQIALGLVDKRPPGERREPQLPALCQSVLNGYSYR